MTKKKPKKKVIDWLVQYHKDKKDGKIKIPYGGYTIHTKV